MRNNRIVVDLNKVQYAWQGWQTIDGQYKRQFKPTEPTVHGHEFDCNAPAFGFHVHGMTMFQRAQSLGILDVWIPFTSVQVTANHRLTYTGKKAESIWKAWCEKQFNKKK